MSQARLDELAGKTGAAMPRLLDARAVSDRRLARRRELLSSLALSEEYSVVFLGSWGRREVTSRSDNDSYYLAAEKFEIPSSVVKAIDGALLDEEREFKGRDATLRPPGRDQMFGQTVALQDLVKKIGLEKDTNRNLTQRMLLVLESVAVHNPVLLERARADVLETYLEAPIKAHQPPRLFLNDVVRYWRTMCVDFAGKMRDRKNQGWGLRNAKLRTTRKMLFASGLIPLLRCSDLEEASIGPFLHKQFRMAPAERLADAFLELDSLTAGKGVFEAYDQFLASVDDESTRSALDAIKSRADADRSAEFQAVARVGDRVEGCLLELLFGPALSATTRRFGIF